MILVKLGKMLEKERIFLNILFIMVWVCLGLLCFFFVEFNGFRVEWDVYIVRGSVKVYVFGFGVDFVEFFEVGWVEEYFGYLVDSVFW